MMKKYTFTRVAVAVALALLLALALVACGECKHEWGEWCDVSAATCTEAGARERACTKCGALEHEEVAALQHALSAYISDVDATCVGGGRETATCDRCGLVDVRETAIDASKHASDAFLMELDASDGAYHVKKHACCGAVAERGEHVLYRYEMALVEGAASCESGVLKTYKCALCDATVTDTVYEHVSIQDEDFMVADAPAHYIRLGEYLNAVGILYAEEPCIRITSDCLCGARTAGIDLVQGEPVHGDKLFDRYLVPFSAFEMPDGAESLRRDVVTAFYTDNLPPDEGGEIHIEYRILFEQLLREEEGRLIYEVAITLGYDEGADTSDAQFTYLLKELTSPAAIGE